MVPAEPRKNSAFEITTPRKHSIPIYRWPFSASTALTRIAYSRASFRHYSRLLASGPVSLPSRGSLTLLAALLISFFGARQVRVVQAFYSNKNWKDEEKEKDGEHKLTVTLEKAIELAGENKNKNKERMDEIIRWMACNPSFLKGKKT